MTQLVIEKYIHLIFTEKCLYLNSYLLFLTYTRVTFNKFSFVNFQNIYGSNDDDVDKIDVIFHLSSPSQSYFNID